MGQSAPSASYDTKLGDEVDVPAATQRDLSSLEKRAGRNFMKISERKCEVLRLGKNNPMHPRRLQQLSG